jgi:hypothetical protein
LEGCLRRDYPNEFSDNEWLGDFLKKIRIAVPPSSPCLAQAQLEDLDFINDFSKRYHHESNTRADSEPLNEEELRNCVQRTLQFIGAI